MKPVALARAVDVVQENLEGNYLNAEVTKKRLLVFPTSEEAGPKWAYQVEYEAGEEDENIYSKEMLGNDAMYLAGFKRVWAYTQGIALAQYARKPGDHNLRAAHGIARMLCGTLSASPGAGAALGWPFSWNTVRDDWRDVRFVTGANAWALHGIGKFITSPAFEALPSEDEKNRVRECYRHALDGLSTHRRALTLEDGRQVVLMTAGWTAAGLKYAEEPWRLKTASGRAVSTDPQERFAYYSVLDAVGYEGYGVSPKIKSCYARPGTNCYDQPLAGSMWRDREISEPEWAALSRRVKADNVVTEHNLDVLAVLNHALEHADALGVSDYRDLRTWRDQLRDGIFFGLWDDQGWKTEFRTALGAMSGQNDRLFGRVDKEYQQVRRQRMKDALAHGDLGRVVTGGEIRTDGSGTSIFVRSVHSAIDNCSWLALSVDYKDLDLADASPSANGVYRRRLRQCLEYTVTQYVRELGFGDTPATTYRGAHYFQNTFKDPYIAPSALQDASYHLEATMGLIMGLNAFVQAYPEHLASASFRDVYGTLWTQAQAFVKDHGFPYSSQRIQNLSTLLVSSTAVIWFIDAYDTLEPQNPTGVGPRGDFEGVSNDQSSESSIVFARTKTASKVASGALKLVDDLLRLPPELVAAALAGTQAMGYLGSYLTEVDTGLETMFIGNDVPSSDLWAYEGVIESEAALAPPLGTYLRDEEDIRSTVPIYPNLTTAGEGTTSGATIFDDARIYYVRSEWFGLDTEIAGRVGVLAPTEGRFWEVYALQVAKSRSELLDSFLKNHALWIQAEATTRALPEEFRRLWLFLVELAIRSDFDRPVAEGYARSVQGNAGGGHNANSDGLSKGTGVPADRNRSDEAPEAHGGSAGAVGPPDGWTPEEARAWLRSVISQRPKLRQDLIALAKKTETLRSGPIRIVPLDTYTDILRGILNAVVRVGVYKDIVIAIQVADGRLMAFEDNGPVKVPDQEQIEALSVEDMVRQLRSDISLFVGHLDNILEDENAEASSFGKIPSSFEQRTESFLASLDAIEHQISALPGVYDLVPLVDYSKTPQKPAVDVSRQDQTAAPKKPQWVLAKGHVEDLSSPIDLVFKHIAGSTGPISWFPGVYVAWDGTQIDESKLQDSEYLMIVEEVTPPKEIIATVRPWPPPPPGSMSLSDFADLKIRIVLRSVEPNGSTRIEMYTQPQTPGEQSRSQEALEDEWDPSAWLSLVLSEWTRKRQWLVAIAEQLRGLAFDADARASVAQRWDTVRHEYEELLEALKAFELRLKLFHDDPEADPSQLLQIEKEDLGFAGTVDAIRIKINAVISAVDVAAAYVEEDLGAENVVPESQSDRATALVHALRDLERAARTFVLPGVSKASVSGKPLGVESIEVFPDGIGTHHLYPHPPTAIFEAGFKNDDEFRGWFPETKLVEGDKEWAELTEQDLLGTDFVIIVDERIPHIEIRGRFRFHPFEKKDEQRVVISFLPTGQPLQTRIDLRFLP